MASATGDRQPYVYLSLGNTDVSLLEDDFRPFDSFMIRVIVLEPADNDDTDLCCAIEVVDLMHARGYGQDSDYEAISYTWGAPVFSHSLFCNGNSRISITPSLDQALRRFRKRDKKRRLWADAVCINQKDAKELAQQVQRMSEIYSNAVSVLVWLGDGPEMDKCIDFLWGLSSPRHEASTQKATAEYSIYQELQRFFGHNDIAAIQRFLALPWFTRRWVVQEAVPRRAHFYCGKLDITAHALHHAIFVLSKSNFDFDSQILDHLRFLEVEAEAWGSEKDGHAVGILDLLVRFNRTSCKDSRDRIYAFLGLANDVKSPFVNITPRRADATAILRGEWTAEQVWRNTELEGSIPIQIDYEADPKHVYIEFAEKMLQNKPHLDLLHCAGAFRPPVTSMSKLYQSWVPDWRNNIRYRPFLSVPWFIAGGEPRDFRPFVNYPWCSVNGFVLDTVNVAYKIPNLDIGGTSTKDRRVMPQVGELCCALRMEGRYFTGERIWQVLAMTFIADHAHNITLKREYTGKSKMYNGRLIKRNARERDMHTLLDWWGDSVESGEEERGGTSNKHGQLNVDQIIKDHYKSTHRSSMTGAFLKPSATANEWGPTSYAKQSHWHDRIDDELEIYFNEHLNKMATRDNNRNKAESSHSNTSTKAKKTKQKKLPPSKAGGKELTHPPTPRTGPPAAAQPTEDDPPDCEWRHLDGRFIYFDPHARNQERYAEAAYNTLCGRSFFVTTGGMVGVGPDDMAEGDSVAVLFGARTPFVLRAAEKGAAAPRVAAGGVEVEAWRLIGDAYVHGVMGGEALTMEGRGGDRQFVLV